MSVRHNSTSGLTPGEHMASLLNQNFLSPKMTLLRGIRPISNIQTDMFLHPKRYKNIQKQPNIQTRLIIQPKHDFTSINITPNYIISKPECKYLYQIIFHNVTSNSASSGLRKMLYSPIPTFLAPKYGGKIWHLIDTQQNEKSTQ